jgi:hypothetical protein
MQAVGMAELGTQVSAGWAPACQTVSGGANSVCAGMSHGKGMHSTQGWP